MIKALWRPAALAAAFLLALSAGGAKAQDMAKDPPLVAFSAGYYDLSGDNSAADFRLEYRHGPAWFGFLKPFAGIEVTTDGALWGGAGLMIDVLLTDNIAFSLSSGPGFYEDGDGKDLGHGLEFRSQAEIAYVMEDRSRIALAISHLSNAGLGDTNPGVEVVSLYYMLPLNF
jgi:hypothetical protein